MKDTTPEAHDIQLQILLKKTPQERFLLGCNMIDATYFIVKNSIEKNIPTSPIKRLLPPFREILSK